ncbi:MAG: FkbM family methyltransferase [Endomicrobium sp.]|nr:FkbM family methyltransferase [Endomicrobium sp.]
MYKKSIDLKSIVRLIKTPLAARKCILYLNATLKTIDDKTIITINKYGVSFYVNTYSDLYCILEVFYLTLYKINFNYNAIVIDIGLNIGTAAVFFAQNKNIEHIYAFEPFKETYEQAESNLNLNKALKDKITIYNYGLSGKDETKNALYSSKMTIYMSVLSENQKNFVSKKDMSYCTVVLKSADKEISDIIYNTKRKIILKMDCEGSEYEIFDSLNRSGVLKRIDYIMLEWHNKGPNYILDRLKENGFTSFALSAVNPICGTIYAVRER